MNTIREELAKLDERRLCYVIERSKVLRDVDGYRNAGISRSSFYEYPVEERARLNELALRLKREAALKARMILEEGVEVAANVLIEQMAGGRRVSESVRQKAAVEVLDRVAGKPTQHQQVEVSGQGGGPIVLRWPEEMEDGD